MERKTIQWDLDAWDDYLYWQAQDKRILKKINQLLRDICRNPFDGTETALVCASRWTRTNDPLINSQML